MIALLDPPFTTPIPKPSFPERIRELQQTVSASRLKTFYECRLKFYFRYVLELDKPTSAALFVGKVVHAVLQEWSIQRWNGFQRASDFYQEVFDHHLANPEEEGEVKWKGEEDGHWQNAWTMIQTYLQETNIPADEKPQAVEVFVEAELPGLPTLIGVLDLVRPGGLIVDYKTTSTTPNPDRTKHQNELQLACYGLLYREATGEKEGGFELHHLVKLKQPKVVMVPIGAVTPSQEARLFRAIKSYLDGLERRDFVPSPGMGCLSCEYFRDCRAWSGDCAAEKGWLAA